MDLIHRVSDHQPNETDERRRALDAGMREDSRKKVWRMPHIVDQLPEAISHNHN